jgi:hypothetical protein
MRWSALLQTPRSGQGTDALASPLKSSLPRQSSFAVDRSAGLICPAATVRFEVNRRIFIKILHTIALW